MAMHDLEHLHIKIWTFIGWILLIYGVLIFGSGIYYLFVPPATTLAHLQPSLWWGAVLLVVGFLFVRLNKIT